MMKTNLAIDKDCCLNYKFSCGTNFRSKTQFSDS